MAEFSAFHYGDFHPDLCAISPTAAGRVRGGGLRLGKWESAAAATATAVTMPHCTHTVFPGSSQLRARHPDRLAIHLNAAGESDDQWTWSSRERLCVKPITGPLIPRGCTSAVGTVVRTAAHCKGLKQAAIPPDLSRQGWLDWAREAQAPEIHCDLLAYMSLIRDVGKQRPLRRSQILGQSENWLQPKGTDMVRAIVQLIFSFVNADLTRASWPY